MEGKALEFKRDLSSPPEGILKAIAAFANTSDGIIVLGVEDDTEAVYNMPSIPDPVTEDQATELLCLDCMASARAAWILVAVAVTIVPGIGRLEACSFTTEVVLGSIGHCDFSKFHPLRIGSDWPQRQDILSQVPPAYSDGARRSGMSGLVTVLLLINAKGSVEQACATGGPGELRKPAEAAARQWKFRPVELNGQPVPYVAGAISFKFVLDAASKGASGLQVFVWAPAGKVIGRLRVPPGFKTEVYNYREGFVTTLHFADGASLVLQAGGMYRIPMFQGNNYALMGSSDVPKKTIRTGRIRGTRLLWREDNYHASPLVGSNLSIFQILPPNIGYHHVAPSRRAEFDEAMDSFQREGDRIEQTKPLARPPN
ncbi:energy transducer TonB [uncultured Paludibaculum sp.]|uniref:energy transducer TonB n=1 Tax=uncultured Paludibaculum sp. TaxID=1765020 RepID=UPI002AABBE2B|nr:energy transducer TonB [uncultured Paludibaculum sp.]